MEDVQRFFAKCLTPVYFISSTGYNLFGLENYVKNFYFISYFDVWNGERKDTFVPTLLPSPNSIYEKDPENYLENLNHVLLEHEEVRDFIYRTGCGMVTSLTLSLNFKVCFLFFNEKTEELMEKLYSGFEICFPSSKIRAHFDSKLTSTLLCNELGFPAIPHVLCAVKNYETLLQIGREFETTELVLQFPYGDSGHSTFFISLEKEEDWNRYANEIQKEPIVKVMKRIECYSSAIEACITKKGVIIAPLQTEMTGFPELTSFKGGWCGNEIFVNAFGSSISEKIFQYMKLLGSKMKQEGYRGYFEVDFLIEKNTNNVYVGEINPRLSGATILTTMALEVPLFLFHLLEWFDIDICYNFDIIHRKFNQKEKTGVWGQLIIKHTGSKGKILKSPKSGLWSIQGKWLPGAPKGIQDESWIFLMNSTRTNDEIQSGTDLARIIVKERLTNENMELNAKAQTWIKFVRSLFQFEFDV